MNEATRRLRSIVDLLPAPMLLIDREGALLAGNEAFRACFVLSRRRARCLKLAGLAADGSAGAPLRLLARAVADGDAWTSTGRSMCETWCRRGDGKRLFCRITVAPLADLSSGAFAVGFEECTALRERCDELEARCAAVVRVADHLDEAVLVGSEDLRSFRFGNAAVEHVLGIAPEVLRAAPRSLLSAIHPDDKAIVATLLADGPPVQEARVRLSSAEGKIRRLRLRVVRSVDTGSSRSLAVLASDDTARVEAQMLADELARASSELAARLHALADRAAPDRADGAPAVRPLDGVQKEFEKRLKTLSPREREVLELLVDGRGTAQICAALGLRPSTVGVHRAALMRKLGVKNSAALLRRLVFSKARRGNL